jgi:hypothetical protein
VPVGLHSFEFFTVLGSTIATIGEDELFLAVKKVCSLVEIVLITQQ